MTGFTIVLKKKRRKYPYKKTKNRRKIIYLLPVILIAFFSVFVSFFLKEDEAESERNTSVDIQTFKTVDDYSAYYNPVVINEFFSYECGDKVEDKTLVKLAVWSILCTEEKEKYESFDGMMTIKKEEIEERVKLLFSEKISFENVSSDEIIYDEKAEMYTVPLMGFSPQYSALLHSVKAEKGKTKITVGCLERESFKQDSHGKTVFPAADKMIEITLSKNKKSFYIESISAVQTE